jgi:hypothetical protein
MDVRAVPEHRYAGGSRHTDADPRADALVAILIADMLRTDRHDTVPPDVAALVERYVDALRDVGLAPECVVIALKDAVRRAHRDGPLARESMSGASERRDSQLISLGIRRLFVTRGAPARYSSVRAEQIVATTMLRSAERIERAVAAVEEASRLVLRAESLRAGLVLDHALLLDLEQNVRDVARAFKRLELKEEETITRVRALMNVAVHRHTELPDRDGLTAVAAGWAHDAYISVA